MSCVKVDKIASIELQDFERDCLVQALKILRNISRDFFEEDAEDTEEAIDMCAARDAMETVLRKHIGIDEPRER